MNRRQFFQRHVVRSATGVLGVLDEVGTLAEESSSAEISLLRFGRPAMATTFEVLLPLGTLQAQVAAEAALEEIDRLESQLTVYRDDSEVSRLNRLASKEKVQVEGKLFALLAQAAHLTAETEGAFDISVGALIKAWGFYRRKGQVPEENERAEVMSRVGMHNVVLDPEQRSVHFLRPGLEINLGSIGKGYALDRAVQLLREKWDIRQALIHGGHSSIFALGDEPCGHRGWAVGIADPMNPASRLAVVRLRNRALGTSAATFQNLEYNGRRLGHILDPRSGWPAEGMRSVTVLAPTAAEADALATAFFILGVEPARAYLAQHPQFGAVLLPAKGRPVVLGIPPTDVKFAFPGSGRNV